MVLFFIFWFSRFVFNATRSLIVFSSLWLFFLLLLATKKGKRKGQRHVASSSLPIEFRFLLFVFFYRGVSV